jgi:hypothetical protein
MSLLFSNTLTQPALSSSTPSIPKHIAPITPIVSKPNTIPTSITLTTPTNPKTSYIGVSIRSKF